MQLILLSLRVCLVDGFMFRVLFRILPSYCSRLKMYAIRLVLIPALTGRAPPNDTERNLFALPPQWGGLGLSNPVCHADRESDASRKISEPLCNFLLNHNLQYFEVKADQLTQKSSV